MKQRQRYVIVFFVLALVLLDAGAWLTYLKLSKEENKLKAFFALILNDEEEDAPLRHVPAMPTEQPKTTGPTVYSARRSTSMLKVQHSVQADESFAVSSEQIFTSYRPYQLRQTSANVAHSIAGGTATAGNNLNRKYSRSEQTHYAISTTVLPFIQFSSTSSLLASVSMVDGRFTDFAANKRALPPTPPEPYINDEPEVPIGNLPWTLLLLFVGGYIRRKYK